MTSEVAILRAFLDAAQTAIEGTLDVSSIQQGYVDSGMDETLAYIWGMARTTRTALDGKPLPQLRPAAPAGVA